MITLASLLVDIDAVATDHPALEQALRLAVRCGARVQIVDVLPRVPAGVRHFVTPDLEKELIDRLTDVAVEWVQGEPEDAIARFVESHGVRQRPPRFGAGRHATRLQVPRGANVAVAAPETEQS